MLDKRKVLNFAQKVETVVDVAKRLKILNIFIADNFDNALEQAQTKSEQDSGLCKIAAL